MQYEISGKHNKSYSKYEEENIYYQLIFSRTGKLTLIQHINRHRQYKKCN